jgi:hypothetical protein
MTTDPPTSGNTEGNVTTLPNKPEDWPRLFERQFNADDLGAIMAPTRENETNKENALKTRSRTTATRTLKAARITS